ncbi:hypothetical protein SLI_3449 [Streptomyces lividans 1326]|uniref:Uncharacterized protein n=1 Tax=Streptomyces lividans 1326 TaxID=1200984 RepID=A0A7U9DQ85_STRLI|nr:hypothetical protein SLI_3449 [Streptomyces lividans 1326]
MDGTSISFFNVTLHCDASRWRFGLPRSRGTATALRDRA